MTYKEEIKISIDFFDTIDFKRFIKPGERIELQDFENSIEEYYGNHRELLPEVFQGYVFNFVNDYELGQYLEKRYGWKICEEVIERHYFIPS